MKARIPFAACAALCALAVYAQPLRLETTIPLPNVKGRIDHFAVDVAGQRLFVAALGNNTVEVVDLRSGKDVHSIAGIREPQGLFYWAGTNRLYIASAADGRVRVLDGRTFEGIKEYDFNGDADNIRFDPAHKEIFVGYGDGALGVINADLRSEVDKTILDAHPESFQLESEGPRIFVNVPGGKGGFLKSGHVSVIDRRTRSIAATWPLESAQQNFPMALDEPNRRLFVGCRRPPRMLVFDTGSGKEVGSAEIPGDADDLFYDAALKRIYVSGGEGAVMALRQVDAARYETIAKIPTAPGARTSLFVPELRRLYVAVPHRGKQPAALMVFAVAE